MSIPRIVLCGSLRQLPAIEAVRDELLRWGIECLIPVAAPVELASLTDDRLRGSEAVRQLKARASRVYFDAIAEPRTAAVLAVNATVEGKPPNYIGPATFSELAVGFAHRKPLFVLHEFFPPFAEELAAWGVIPLHGELGPAIAAWEQWKAGLSGN